MHRLIALSTLLYKNVHNFDDINDDIKQVVSTEFASFPTAITCIHIEDFHGIPDLLGKVIEIMHQTNTNAKINASKWFGHFRILDLNQSATTIQHSIIRHNAQRHAHQEDGMKLGRPETTNDQYSRRYLCSPREMISH